MISIWYLRHLLGNRQKRDFDQNMNNNSCWDISFFFPKKSKSVSKIGNKMIYQNFVSLFGVVINTIIPVPFLTLPILRLLSSKAQGCKVFWKTSKPCQVGIHRIDLAEYYWMITILSRIQSFFNFCIILCCKNSTSNIGVNHGKFRTQLWVTCRFDYIPNENSSEEWHYLS